MSGLLDRQTENNIAQDSPNGQESLRVRVRDAVRQVESAIIREALDQHRWNRRRAAAALKISYRSLMYKMKTCNLRDSRPVSQNPEELSLSE
jgi:two-component system response regulator AtoC